MCKWKGQKRTPTSLIQLSQSTRGEVVRALKSICLEEYPLITFWILYFAVIELGIALPYKSLNLYQTGFVMLLTSPFSYLETIGKTPAETTQGLVNNLFVPSVMMLFAMVYNLNFSNRLRRFVSVPPVFGASVIGTYVVADAVWKLKPLPSTGTSIIGFCFCAALSGAAFADLYDSRRSRGDPRPSKGMFVRFVTIGLIGALGLVIGFYGYLWMNPSWMLHLAGGGVSFLFLYLWTQLGNPSIRKLPRALLHESSRSVLFLLVALAVALVA